MCVSAERAAAVAAATADAGARTLAAAAWGPCQCKAGLLWRLADGFDWVCTSEENKRRIADQVGLGPGGCGWGCGGWSESSTVAAGSWL